MKRIKLVTAYDGTSYHGSQIQNNGVTIEGVLKEELSSLLKEEINLIGASRTDAGVHALGNVYVFDTDSRIPAEKFVYALNARLPEDIRIQHSCEVPPDFHPRHQDTVKTYEYRIFNAPMPDPMRRLYTYYSRYRFDVEAMREAGRYLVGEHDFKSFCSMYTSAKTTVREILNVEVEEIPCGTRASLSQVCRMPREIVIRVSGRGFLYNMVRIIAGTLIKVGSGDIAPEEIPVILEKCDKIPFLSS